jgi:hypothetical protein
MEQGDLIEASTSSFCGCLTNAEADERLSVLRGLRPRLLSGSFAAWSRRWEAKGQL